MESKAKKMAELMEQKKRAKKSLQEDLGWKAEERTALLCVPSTVSDATGAELLLSVLPGLLEMPLQIVVLGKGNATYGKKLTELSKQFEERLAILASDDDVLTKMLQGSDMALFCAGPALEEVEQAWKHGTVPLCPMHADIADYDPNQETGTAFCFEEATPWQCFAAIVRALETYRFPFDWRTIARHGVKGQEEDEDED